MDKSGYYNIYDKLWKSNQLPGYVRVNAGVSFRNKDGESGKMMIFRKKQSI